MRTWLDTMLWVVIAGIAVSLAWYFIRTRGPAVPVHRLEAEEATFLARRDLTGEVTLEKLRAAFAQSVPPAVVEQPVPSPPPAVARRRERRPKPSPAASDGAGYPAFAALPAAAALRARAALDPQSPRAPMKPLVPRKLKES